MFCNQYYVVCLVFSLTFSQLLVSFPSHGVTLSEQTGVESDERYQLGKTQYEDLKRETRMPKYSKCWLDSLRALEHGCSRLTDDLQHRMSLGFANCFLQKTGRKTHECTADMDISECTHNMDSDAYNTFGRFFLQTQNMCFFLQAQIWHQQTESTIHKLADNSAHVAKQIEDSSSLQSEILKQQNDSLKNQELLMNRGNELKSTLEASTVDVHKMLNEFKSSTMEQRTMILEVFDRINKLNSIVLGEFTGFYSLIFYAVSILISYLLTSTRRTKSSRLPLFIIMTTNIVLERVIVVWGAKDHTLNPGGQVISSETVIYSRLWWCRRVFLTLAVSVWIWLLVTFKDHVRTLLEDIKQQNAELKNMLQKSSQPQRVLSPPALPGRESPPHRLVSHLQQHYQRRTQEITCGKDVCDSPLKIADCSNTEGYESGSESDDSLDSTRTDHTFRVDEDFASSDSDDSFMTLDSGRGSRAGTPAMLDELRFLRQATPLKRTSPTPNVTDISMNESDYQAPSNSGPRSRKRRTKTKSQTPVGPPRYFLRSRTPTPNPQVEVESADEFGKVVQHLAKVAMRNRVKASYTIKRLSEGQPDPKFFSSDDDE